VSLMQAKLEFDICSNLKGIPDEILKLQNGKCLFIGKIVNVSRVRYLHDWFRVWVNFISFFNRKYEPALHGAKFALQGFEKMSWKTYLKE